jgi:hypothetical protein
MVGVSKGELTMLGADGWQHGPAFRTAEGIGTITSSDSPGTKAAAFARERVREHLLQSRRRLILPKAKPVDPLHRPVIFHRIGQR